MPVPFSFGAATSAIPLSQLDSNFNTPITLGNTAIQLGNTVTTLNNMTLANVTISSGNVTITNVTVTTANATTVNTTTLIATTANVTTGNVTNLISGNVTLTGGSITGTPISGSTGSFTTLTTSGTVTLNGGVANGVAYLDGSKVLTTGSGLVTDGSSLGLGGTPLCRVDASGTIRSTSTGNPASGVGAELSWDGTSGYAIAFNRTAGTWQPMTVGGSYLAYLANGTEQMRLTSTGLGIGTSSPGAKLDVVGAIRSSNSGNENYFLNDGSSRSSLQQNSNAIYFNVNDNSATNGQFIWRSSNALTERMRLDASGNLGLGVTPSVWGGSGVKAFDVGAGASFAGSGSDAGMIANAYFNGSNWIYKTSSLAVRYQQLIGTGAHAWYTAPSGTAGNAISFTQAMTLDASSRLSLGTTSASGRLNVAAIDDTVSGGIRLWGFNDGTANGDRTIWISAISGSGNYNANINYSAWQHIFTANGSERARITSGGELLVGTTTAYGVGGLTTAPGGTAAAVLSWNKTDTTNQYAAQFRYSGTIVGSIEYTNTATSFVTSSDYRLKENITPMTGALEKVAALKPCTYKWKVDGSAGEGFIAHELAEVVPQAVTGSKDAVNEDGSIKPQGIDTSFLVATLTAAIQELKAEFDAYKATHP